MTYYCDAVDGGDNYIGRDHFLLKRGTVLLRAVLRKKKKKKVIIIIKKKNKKIFVFLQTFFRTKNRRVHFPTNSEKYARPKYEIYIYIGIQIFTTKVTIILILIVEANGQRGRKRQIVFG